MSRHGNQVRFRFIQFPLVNIHPLAFRAAVIAEYARQHGKFWEQHHALFLKHGLLDKAFLDKLESSSDTATAQKMVGADVEIGNKIGVDSTPSLYVCTPERKIFRLGGLNGLDQFFESRGIR